MAFYHLFTSPRLTSVFLPALVDTLRTQDPTAGVFVSYDAPPNTIYKVKKDTTWTQQQINFAQNAINNAPQPTIELIVKKQVDAMSLFEKAFILTLVDQINVLRVNAGLPIVTQAQVMTAIKNKVDTL